MNKLKVCLAEPCEAGRCWSKAVKYWAAVAIAELARDNGKALAMIEAAPVGGVNDAMLNELFRMLQDAGSAAMITSAAHGSCTAEQAGQPSSSSRAAAVTLTVFAALPRFHDHLCSPKCKDSLHDVVDAFKLLHDASAGDRQAEARSKIGLLEAMLRHDAAPVQGKELALQSMLQRPGQLRPSVRCPLWSRLQRWHLITDLVVRWCIVNTEAL